VPRPQLVIVDKLAITWYSVFSVFVLTGLKR